MLHWALSVVVVAAIFGLLFGGLYLWKEGFTVLLIGISFGVGVWAYHAMLFDEGVGIFKK